MRSRSCCLSRKISTNKVHAAASEAYPVLKIQSYVSCQKTQADAPEMSSNPYARNDFKCLLRGACNVASCFQGAGAFSHWGASHWDLWVPHWGVWFSHWHFGASHRDIPNSHWDWDIKVSHWDFRFSRWDTLYIRSVNTKKTPAPSI